MLWGSKYRNVGMLGANRVSKQKEEIWVKSMPTVHSALVRRSAVAAEVVEVRLALDTVRENRVGGGF